MFSFNSKTQNLDLSGPGQASARNSETIERRSPFAQSIYITTTPDDTTFSVTHPLRVSGEDVVYAQIVQAEGDVRIWKDPSDSQPPGSVTLRCSTAGIPLVLLLFIPRP